VSVASPARACSHLTRHRGSNAGHIGRSSFSGDYRLRPAPFGDFRLLPVRDLRGMERSRRSLCQIHMLICSAFTGATGLEPATSGVTGRSWRLRAERGSAGIPAVTKAFRPWRCGDSRVLAGASGAQRPLSGRENLGSAEHGASSSWDERRYMRERPLPRPNRERNGCRGGSATAPGLV
jgi:hypothetical protein